MNTNPFPSVSDWIINNSFLQLDSKFIMVPNVSVTKLIVHHRTQYKFSFFSHKSKIVLKHSLKSVQYSTRLHVKILKPKKRVLKNIVS